LISLRAPKHGQRTLPRRRALRARRRAALAMTWSRTMALVRHPISLLADKAEFSTRRPDLAGDQRRAWARRVARRELKQQRAVRR